jgi:hypothetical protein
MEETERKREKETVEVCGISEVWEESSCWWSDVLLRREDERDEFVSL